MSHVPFLFVYGLFFNSKTRSVTREFDITIPSFSIHFFKPYYSPSKNGFLSIPHKAAICMCKAVILTDPYFLNEQRTKMLCRPEVKCFSLARRQRSKVRRLLKGLNDIIGHPIKKQKLVFASIKFQTEWSMFLFKSIFLHSNSSLSSVVRDDKGGNELKLYEVSPTFSSLNAIPANIIEIIMVRAP